MKLGKLFTLCSVAALCTFSASAETMSAEWSVDFSNYDAGKKFNSFWGGENDNIMVVENPDGAEFGNVLYVSGCDNAEENPNSWSTLARVPGVTLPAGYSLPNVLMVEMTYKPTQDDGVLFGIQMRNPDVEYLQAEGDESAEYEGWYTIVLDGAELVNADGVVPTASSFDLCVGAKGSSHYYIKEVKFYLEKEVSQREIDEAALDKATAPCVILDFDDLAEGPSEHIGSNGGATNRADMIIDKGPEGYDNNCVHIIYGGYTNIFLWNLITCPEGYTFDDLRQVEYDIYETEIAGVDSGTTNEYPGKNGAPVLKIKDKPWSIDSNANGSSCGNTSLSSVNEWHHVTFAPSAIEWAARDFTVTEGEGDDAVETQVHWDGDQTRDEMGKVSSFAISVGFFPCLNQCYVDNVKLWFQKSSTSAVNTIEAAEEVAQGYTVYNLQGILVLKTADKAAVDALPAGIYIINGKKHVIK